MYFRVCLWLDIPRRCRDSQWHAFEEDFVTRVAKTELQSWSKRNLLQISFLARSRQRSRNVRILFAQLRDASLNILELAAPVRDMGDHLLKIFVDLPVIIWGCDRWSVYRYSWCTLKLSVIIIIWRILRCQWFYWTLIFPVRVILVNTDDIYSTMNKMKKYNIYNVCSFGEKLRNKHIMIFRIFQKMFEKMKENL